MQEKKKIISLLNIFTFGMSSLSTQSFLQEVKKKTKIQLTKTEGTGTQWKAVAAQMIPQAEQNCVFWNEDALMYRQNNSMDDIKTKQKKPKLMYAFIYSLYLAFRRNSCIPNGVDVFV